MILFYITLHQLTVWQFGNSSIFIFDWYAFLMVCFNSFVRLVLLYQYCWNSSWNCSSYRAVKENRGKVSTQNFNNIVCYNKITYNIIFAIPFDLCLQNILHSLISVVSLALSFSLTILYMFCTSKQSFSISIHLPAFTTSTWSHSLPKQEKMFAKSI